MLLLNPKKYQDRNYPDDRSKEIMLKTIEWFENKGMRKINEDYYSRDFPYDFAEFMKKERIFETLFLPKGYGDPDQYYSSYRMYRILRDHGILWNFILVHFSLFHIGDKSFIDGR